LSFRTKAPRADKVEQVEEMRSALNASSATVLATYNNLSVKAASDLRTQLRGANAQFRVVKNTLFKLAAEGTAVESLVGDLAGPTAVVTTAGDPVELAKILTKFEKESKGQVGIKSGCIEGQVITAAQVEALSKIPPKNVLVAQVVGGIQAPITGLVGTLQSTLAQLVMTLSAVAEKSAA
jgi:large subunit ribosomal protein L10